MKLASLLILVTLGSSLLCAQGRTWHTNRVPTTVTTTWDSVYIGTGAYSGLITNDAASGTDTLFVANGNDTLSTQIFPIYQGTNLSIKDFGFKSFFRRKTSANTIKSRYLLY